MNAEARADNLRHFSGRAAWIAIAGLAMALFLVAVPARYAALQHACTAPSSDCSARSLPTPQNARELEAGGLSLAFNANVDVGASLLLFGVYCAVALAIFLRRPDNPAALAASLLLVLLAAGDAKTLAFAPAVLAGPAKLLALLSSLAFPLFFGLFPNGRFVPGWMRWVVLAFGAFLLSGVLLPGLYAALGPGSAQLIGPPFWIAMFLASLAAQVYRFRRVSNAAERRQTK